MSLLFCFSSNPEKAHWKAMKYTIAYVKDTINYRITYHYGAKLQFIDFVDSDYTNNCNTRILTNEHVFYVEEVPVLWLTKRQETVVTSMTKAEYMAASRTVEQAIWLSSFFNGSLLPQKQPYCLLTITEQ